MVFSRLKSSSTNSLLSLPFFYLTIPPLLVEGASFNAIKPLPISLAPSSRSLSYNVSEPVIALAIAPVRCTSLDEWVKPRYIEEDCNHVVHNIFGPEVERYGDIELEFVDLGTAPSGQFRFMQTPRKYRFRSCTMAIVMLDFFIPGEVPGTGRGPFPNKDISTLRQAFTAARNVLHLCLQIRRELGWLEIGKGLLLSRPLY